MRFSHKLYVIFTNYEISSQILANFIKVVSFGEKCQHKLYVLPVYKKAWFLFQYQSWTSNQTINISRGIQSLQPNSKEESQSVYHYSTLPQRIFSSGHTKYVSCFSYAIVINFKGIFVNFLQFS